MSDPGDDAAGTVRSSGRSPSDLLADGLARLRDVPLVYLVGAVAVLAVLARAFTLGARTFHWDEARVGYWILYYVDSGSFTYRHAIHGPLIQQVNHWLFPLVGASDFTARLPVALVGGLLPLSALLFRKHLDRAETVALSLFLGSNAVLLYYSRFMRSDILVAAFMFTAFGFLVRLYDTRQFRYLYAASAFAALGFASKENAIVYLLTWVGATVLLTDQALYRPRKHPAGLALLRQTWPGRLLRYLFERLWAAREALQQVREGAPLGEAIGDPVGRALRAPSSGPRRLFRYGGHALGAVVLFFAVIVFFFAPRGLGHEGLMVNPEPAKQNLVGLYQALGSPLEFPGYAIDVLQGTFDEFSRWFNRTSNPGCGKSNIIDGYICFLGRYVEVMYSHALILSLFAVLGFLYERYIRPQSRNLVMFASYVGFVSVLGYPLGTDIFGAWIVVHAVVPLALPAAVVFAGLYKWWRDAAVDRDTVAAVIIAAVLVLVSLQAGVVAATSSYETDQSSENNLVQYAQPGSDLGPTVEGMETIAAENQGTDVLLYYGESGEEYDTNIAFVRQPGEDYPDMAFEPLCSRWFNTLPLPWYFETTGADLACENNARNLTARAQAEQPPMILALQADDSLPTGQLSETYERQVVRIRSYDREMVVFVHEDWTDRIDGWPSSP
jgi:uncharacterized protein (TIGR03663 family)